MAQQRKPLQFKPVTAPDNYAFSFPKGYAGGIDISESPDMIALNCSPDMCNMNYDAGGVPTKRKGFDLFQTVGTSADPIRGIFEYEAPGRTPALLIFCGSKMYEVRAGTTTLLASGINDAQIDGFVFDDKFYFLTGTQYKVYDGSTVVDVVGYVPTLLTGCAPTGGGIVNEAYNLLSNSWKVSFSGTSAATIYQMNLTNLTSIDKVWVGGVLKASPADYTVNLANGTVTFSTAPGEGTDNVVIQATKNGLKDSTIITKCTFHALYGGKDDTRVMFYGNPDYRNFRFASGLFDPTYFPDDGDTEIGSNAEAIQGAGRLSDYLIQYSEHRSYYTNVESATDSIQFPVLPMNDEYGCASWRTVKPGQGGLLALSYKGVTWTVPSFVRGQLNTTMISKKINKPAGGEIPGILSTTKAEKEAAHAVVWDNKYILIIAGKAWVLDLLYSDLSDGEYCWYPYTGQYTTATQLFEMQEDGKLYLGGAHGDVYRSNDTYRDDDKAIDGWWKSPLIAADKNYVKKFHRLNTVYSNQAEATHILTIYTEDDITEVLQSYEDSRAFNFDDIDFDSWTFGTSPYPETVSEKLNIKAEHLQWKHQNNTIDQGLTVLSQSLIYSNVKAVK